MAGGGRLRAVVVKRRARRLWRRRCSRSVGARPFWLMMDLERWQLRFLGRSSGLCMGGRGRAGNDGYVARCLSESNERCTVPRRTSQVIASRSGDGRHGRQRATRCTSIRASKRQPRSTRANNNNARPEQRRQRGGAWLFQVLAASVFSTSPAPLNPIHSPIHSLLSNPIQSLHDAGQAKDSRCWFGHQRPVVRVGAAEAM